MLKYLITAMFVLASGLSAGSGFHVAPSEEVSGAHSAHVVSGQIANPDFEEMTLRVFAISFDEPVAIEIGRNAFVPETGLRFEVEVAVDYSKLAPASYGLAAAIDRGPLPSLDDISEVGIDVVRRSSQESPHSCFCEEDHHHHDHLEDELVDLVADLVVFTIVVAVDIVDHSCSLSQGTSPIFPLLVALLCLMLLKRRASCQQKGIATACESR